MDCTVTGQIQIQIQIQIRSTMKKMVDCTVTGQGAGTAAAISIKVSSQDIKFLSSSQDIKDFDPIQAILPHRQYLDMQEGVGTLEVDVKKVQEELVKQGARIH